MLLAGGGGRRPRRPLRFLDRRRRARHGSRRRLQASSHERMLCRRQRRVQTGQEQGRPHRRQVQSGERQAQRVNVLVLDPGGDPLAQRRVDRGDVLAVGAGGRQRRFQTTKERLERLQQRVIDGNGKHAADDPIDHDRSDVRLRQERGAATRQQRIEQLEHVDERSTVQVGNERGDDIVQRRKRRRRPHGRGRRQRRNDPRRYGLCRWLLRRQASLERLDQNANDDRCRRGGCNPTMGRHEARRRQVESRRRRPRRRPARFRRRLLAFRGRRRGRQLGVVHGSNRRPQEQLVDHVENNRDALPIRERGLPVRQVSGERDGLYKGIPQMGQVRNEERVAPQDVAEHLPNTQ